MTIVVLPIATNNQYRYIKSGHNHTQMTMVTYIQQAMKRTEKIQHGIFVELTGFHKQSVMIIAKVPYFQKMHSTQKIQIMTK